MSLLLVIMWLLPWYVQVPCCLYQLVLASASHQYVPTGLLMCFHVVGGCHKQRSLVNGFAENNK